VNADPIKRDDVVWVRWQERFGPDWSPTQSVTHTDRPEDWVRGKVLEVIGFSEWPPLRIAIGTGLCEDFWPGNYHRIDEPISLLAHADGACIYCLGNIHGRLVSRFGTIKARCEVCYPPIFATPEMWTIPLRNVAVTGNTLAVKMTWTMATTQTGPDPLPSSRPSRPGFREPARGRFRPPVSPGERQQRLHRMRDHERHPQR